MKYKNLLALNLQKFADDNAGNEGGSSDTPNDGGEDNGNQNQSNSGNGNGETGEKTFTQAELSAVAATEKKQGKQSILNLFGVKSEKDAKEQAEAFKKWQESQKDTEQKLKDSESNLAEANAKAAAAESKLACVMAGVNKDSIDDALAVASLKVTENKDLSAVLEEMKKEPKYSGFFSTSSSSSNGTGTPDGHSGGAGGNGSVENIGARLGKARNQEQKKSNFFKN